MRVGENAIMKTRPSICALCHRPLDGGGSNRAARRGCCAAEQSAAV